MKATRKTNRNDRRFNRARIRERQKVRYSGGAQGYKGAKGVEGRESGVKANQAPRYIDGQEFQWHGRPFTSTSGKRYANGWAYAIIGGGRFRGYVEYNEALQAKGKGQDPEKGVDKGEGEKSEKLETVDNKWKANHAEPSEKEAERLRDYRNTLRREWTKVFRRVADLKDAGRERDAKKLLVAAGNKYIKLAREAYEKWGDGEAFNILNSYDLENGGAAGFKKWLENHLYGVLKSDSNDIRALADKADVKTTEREEEIEKPYREKARRDLQEESWEDSAPDASDSWEEEEEGSTLAPEEAAREIGNESETEETEESEAEEEPAEEETAETVESADDAFAAIRRLSTLGGARIATSAARRRLAEEAVAAFKYLGEKRKFGEAWSEALANLGDKANALVKLEGGAEANLTRFDLVLSHVADRSQKLIDRGLAYDALQVMRPFAADVLTLRDGSPDLFDAKQRETVSEEEPEEEYEEEKEYEEEEEYDDEEPEESEPEEAAQDVGLAAENEVENVATPDENTDYDDEEEEYEPAPAPREKLEAERERLVGEIEKRRAEGKMTSALKARLRGIERELGIKEEAPKDLGRLDDWTDEEWSAGRPEPSEEAEEEPTSEETSPAEEAALDVGDAANEEEAVAKEFEERVNERAKRYEEDEEFRKAEDEKAEELANRDLEGEDRKRIVERETEEARKNYNGHSRVVGKVRKIVGGVAIIDGKHGETVRITLDKNSKALLQQAQESGQWVEFWGTMKDPPLNKNGFPTVPTNAEALRMLLPFDFKILGETPYGSKEEKTREQESEPTPEEAAQAIGDETPPAETAQEPPTETEPPTEPPQTEPEQAAQNVGNAAESSVSDEINREMDARALRDAPERLRKEAESVSPYSGTPQEKRNNAKLLLVTVNGLLNNSELVGTHRDEYAYQRAFAEAKQAEDLLEKGKGHHALNKAIKAAKFLANVIEQKNNGVKPNSKAVPRNYEAPPKVEDETGNEGVYSRELINELDLGYVKKEILAKNETEKLAALEKAAEIIEIFNVDKDTRKKEQFGFTALNSGAIIRNVYAIQTALRSFGIDVPDKQLWGNYIQTTPNGTVSDAAVRKAGKNAVDLWKKYAQTIKDKAEQAAQGNGEEAREPAPSEAIEPAPNPAAESEPTPEEAVQAIGNEAQAPAVESETPPDETATIETANEAEPSDQPVEPTETAAPDVGAETSSPVPEDGEQAARDVWASMNAPDEESEKAAPLSDSEKKKYIEYNPFAKREVPRSEIRTEIEDAYKKVSGEEFPVNDQAKFKGGYGYLCDDPDVVREAARTYKAIHSGKKDENGLYDIKPYNQAQIKLGRLCEQKLSERDAFAKRDKLVKGIKRALRYLQIEESDYYGTEQTSKTNGLQRLDVKDRISRNLDRLEKTRDVLRATELTTAIREELAGYVARTRKEFGKEEAERIAVLFGLLNPDNLLNGESLKTNEGVGEPGVWNLSYNSNEAGRPDLRQLVGIVGEFVDRLKNEPDNPVFEKTLLARVLTLHGELTEHERSKVAPLYRAMREAYLNGNSKKYLANAEKLSKMLSESPRLVNPEGEEIDEGSFDDDVPAYFRRKASNDAKTLTEEIDKLIEAKGDPNEIWDKAKRAYILATDAGLLDKDEYSYLDRSLRGSAGSFGQVASVVRDLKDALRPAFAKLAHYNFPDYAYEWDRPANTKKSEQAAQAVGSEVAPKEPESEPSAPPTETAAREVAPEPTASEPAPSEEVAQKIGNEAEQETVPAPSETEPAQEAAPSSPVGKSYGDWFKENASPETRREMDLQDLRDLPDKLSEEAKMPEGSTPRERLNRANMLYIAVKNALKNSILKEKFDVDDVVDSLWWRTWNHLLEKGGKAIEDGRGANAVKHLREAAESIAFRARLKRDEEATAQSVASEPETTPTVEPVEQAAQSVGNAAEEPIAEPKAEPTKPEPIATKKSRFSDLGKPKAEAPKPEPEQAAPSPNEPVDLEKQIDFDEDKVFGKTEIEYNSLDDVKAHRARAAEAARRKIDEAERFAQAAYDKKRLSERDYRDAMENVAEARRMVNRDPVGAIEDIALGHKTTFRSSRHGANRNPLLHSTEEMIEYARKYGIKSGTTGKTIQRFNANNVKGCASKNLYAYCSVCEEAGVPYSTSAEPSIEVETAFARFLEATAQAAKGEVDEFVVKHLKDKCVQLIQDEESIRKFTVDKHALERYRSLAYEFPNGFQDFDSAYQAGKTKKNSVFRGMIGNSYLPSRVDNEDDPKVRDLYLKSANAYVDLAKAMSDEGVSKPEASERTKALHDIAESAIIEFLKYDAEVTKKRLDKEADLREEKMARRYGPDVPQDVAKKYPDRAKVLAPLRRELFERDRDFLAKHGGSFTRFGQYVKDDATGEYHYLNEAEKAKTPYEFKRNVNTLIGLMDQDKGIEKPRTLQRIDPDDFTTESRLWQDIDLALNRGRRYDSHIDIPFDLAQSSKIREAWAAASNAEQEASVLEIIAHRRKKGWETTRFAEDLTPEERKLLSQSKSKATRAKNVLMKLVEEELKKRETVEKAASEGRWLDNPPDVASGGDDAPFNFDAAAIRDSEKYAMMFGWGRYNPEIVNRPRRVDAPEGELCAMALGW